MATNPFGFGEDQSFLLDGDDFVSSDPVLEILQGDENGIIPTTDITFANSAETYNDMTIQSYMLMMSEDIRSSFFKDEESQEPSDASSTTPVESHPTPTTVAADAADLGLEDEFGKASVSVAGECTSILVPEEPVVSPRKGGVNSRMSLANQSIANSANTGSGEQPTFSMSFLDEDLFKDSDSSRLTLSSSIQQTLMNGTRAVGASVLCDEPSMALPISADNVTMQNSSMLDFVASTPMLNHHPHFGDVQDLLGQSGIHVSPRRKVDFLELPTRVDVPEVCCVQLSQQVHFNVKNKLNWGVKCVFTVKEMAFNGKVTDGFVCPFDVKRQIIMRPSSQETVQVLFTPNYAGEFSACLEVQAQNLTNTEEATTYQIRLTGRAEIPRLKVSPNSEEIDFGDLLWGSTSCRRILVKNSGQSTLPIRFSVMRTNSALCSFSFHCEDSLDVSRISMTSRPLAANNVISMSLPATKQDEEVAVTQSVDLYCHLKGSESKFEKYREACEEFEGLLNIEVDTPVLRQRPLVQYRLRVRAGTIKLHLDTNSLVLSCIPGEVKQGAVKVINSGNISMKVDLHLEPVNSAFYLHPPQMTVEPHAFQKATVSFKPPEDFTEAKLNLVLSDQTYIHYLPVTGLTKRVATKINASAAYITFEGVSVGDKITKKYTFHLQQDVQVHCWVRHGENPAAFHLASDEGTVQQSVDLNVIKGARYSLNVVFTPDAVKSYSSMLVLQVVRGDSFSIPLTGYGGVCCVNVSGVTQAKTGESVISLGVLDSRTPVIRHISISNTGVRSAFVKAVIHDDSRQEMSPRRATIMPSHLFLAPNQSQEVTLMFVPSETDKYSRRSLLGLIKLSFGDEVLRQLLIRNGGADCQRVALMYNMDLTPDQKSVVEEEMNHIKMDKGALNLFKSSARCKKIGLLCEATQGHTQPPVSRSSAGRGGSLVSIGLRPVLQAVNLNVPATKMDKESCVWSLSPASVSLKVLDARSRELAQIINFSDKDVGFSVEPDKCLNVWPSKGTVASKSWCQLELTTSSQFWSETNKPSCALVKVKCNEDTKHIQVFFQEVDSGVTFPPTFGTQTNKSHQITNSETTTTTTTAASSKLVVQPIEDWLQNKLQPRSTNSLSAVERMQPVLDKPVTRLASSCHQRPTTTATHTPAPKAVQASDMVIIPPAGRGESREITYAFTNTSKELINWKLSPWKPLSCEDVTTGDVEVMETSSVFRPCPLSGSLEAGGVQVIGLEFHPPVVGSYSQPWGIKYGKGEQQTDCHTFKIYAKAYQTGTVDSCSQPTRETSGDSRLSRKKTQANNVPHWTAFPPQSEAAVNSIPSSAATDFTTATTTTTTVTTAATRRPVSSVGDDTSGVPRSAGSLQLVEKSLRFPTTKKGGSETMFLQLKNTSARDAEITIEHEPHAPFIIRHINFCVRKDRMTKLPIIFKPLHVDKFRELVVLRDKCSNVTLTAVLEAECIP